MSLKHWQQLLSDLQVENTPVPSHEQSLDSFEKSQGFQLPSSYRDYCVVFGPGEIAGWYFVATPEYNGPAMERYNLMEKTQQYHELEWKEYSSNPDQFERAMIFADDSATAIYFWDPAEKSKGKGNEYRIYALFRDWTIQSLCSTFTEFIDICFQRNKSDFRLYDDPAPLKFRAVKPPKPRGQRRK